MADTRIKRLDAIAARRGAAVLLEALRYIFGNPGTTELALMDALNGGGQDHAPQPDQSAAVR
jgi:thiamine pyrophosphate-dependent acetolactate synthase large subunit-like protein